MFSVGLDINDFEKNSNKVNQQFRNIGDTAEREGGKIDVFSKNLKRGLLGALSITAVTAFVRQVSRVRGEFESLEIAIQTFLGSKEKADKLMAQIAKTAAITPFTMQEVSQGAQQLLAFGVEAEKVDETLRQLGNVASGVNRSLGDIIAPFGRIQATGRVATLDLQTLAARGVPVYEELARVIGITSEEVGKMATAGTITREHITEMFRAMSAEGGKFAGLMEKAAVGTKGLSANLGVAIEAMQNDIGKKLQPAVNAALQGGINLAENYKEVAKVIGEAILVFGSYRAALIAINTIQGLTTKGSFSLKTAVDALSGSFKRLTASMMANPIGLLAAAIAATTYAIYKVITAEKAADKATREYNEANEKAIKIAEERRQKIEGLIATSNDLSLSESERNDSLQDLIAIYPSIIQKYIDEEGRLRNILELKKEIAGVEAAQAEEKKREELAELRQKIDSRKKMLSDNVGRAYRSDEATARMEAQLEEWQTKEQLILKEFQDKRDKEAQREWQISLKKLTDEQIKEQEYQTRRKYEAAGEAEKGALKRQLDVLNAEMESRAGDSKANILNYSYWEEIKKKAEEALKAMDSSQAGSQSWVELTSTITKAEQEMAKFTVTTKENAKVTKEAEKEAFDVYARLEQEKVNALKDGAEKKLRQRKLDYEAELRELNKLKDERLALSAEEEVAFVEIQRTIENRYLSDIRAIQEEGLEEYRGYAEKRKEILEKYQSLDLSNEESIEIARARMDAELKALDQEFLAMYTQFESWADAISSLGVNELEKALLAARVALTELSPDDAQNAVLRAKIKKLEEELRKTKKDDSSVEKWDSLYRIASSTSEVIGNIGDKLGGTFGTLVKDVTGFSDSLLKSKLAFSQIGKHEKGSTEGILATLGAYGAAFEAALKLPQIVESTAKFIFDDSDDIRVRNQLVKDKVDLQYNYNKALREELDIKNQLFGGSMLDNIDAVTERLTMARKEYFRVFDSEGKDAYLTFLGNTWGSLEEIKKQRSQMQIKTAGSKSILGIKYKNAKYENLEEWLKKEGYGDLFDEKGFLNLGLAESVIKMDNLTDATKTFLNQLIDAQKEIEKMEEMLDQAVDSMFGSLGEASKNYLVDYFKNGKDAAIDFRREVSDVMENVAAEMAKSLFLNDIIASYQDSLKKAYKQYALDGDENTLANTIADITELFVGATESAGEQAIGFLENFKEIADRYGFKLFKEEDATSKQIGGYQTLSEDTGRLLEGRANAILTYVSLINSSAEAVKTDISAMLSYSGITAEKLTEMRNLSLTSIDYLHRIAKGTDNLGPMKEDIGEMKRILRDKL